MLSIIPIGGMGTVTKNMYLYQFKDQILILDCGIGFPDLNMPGVDLLIPDTSYLQSHRNNIVGMILTHGHDDHIGGLPHVLPKLGNIPIYGSPLTLGFAADRLAEFKIKPNFNPLPHHQFNLGPFTITPIKVTHSVPDSRHFFIKTQTASIYHGSDYKIDPNPVDSVTTELDKIASLGKQGTTFLLSDCLRIEKPGHSLSESLLKSSFEREIKDAKGKLIITLMSSNIHRVQLAVDTAIKHGRQVSFIGRSVESNVKTARNLGFLKIPQNLIMNKRQIKKADPHKVVVIVAGSQGQEGSSLTRAVTGSHPILKINSQDKVIFASEAIPGNEDPVYSLIDKLSENEIDVAYSDVDQNLHVSGHAYKDEQIELMKLLNPRYLVPIGGTFRHMIQYRKLALELGYKKDQVFLLKNGQILAFENGQAHLRQKIALKELAIDGDQISDLNTPALKERRQLAQEGVLIISISLNKKTKSLSGPLEIISRGLGFNISNNSLNVEIQKKIASLISSYRGKISNPINLKSYLDSKLRHFLAKKLNQSPLVVTLIKTF